LITGRVLIAWPVLAAMLLMFGTAGFALTLGSDPIGERERLIEDLIPLWRLFALASLVLSPLLLLAITAGMAQTSWREAIPLMPEVLRATHAGWVWEWRLIVTAALVIVTLAPMRRIVAAWSMLFASGALLMLESLTSHAIDISVAAVGIDCAHEMAAALWLGAVFGLWFGAGREKLGIDWVEYAAPWVSRLAGWTVTALILSGLFIAYHQLAGDPRRIIYAVYGRTLMVKLGAASVVLLIGAYNRFVLMPELDGPDARERLLRNVGIESLLLCGVAGLATLLANTPPAH
jgi:putative copper resistance protein D